MTTGELLVAALFGVLICSAIGSALGSRTRNSGTGALLGALLGPIGVVAAACLRPPPAKRRIPPPPGADEPRLYLARAGQTFGPHTLPEIWDLLQTGQITAQDHYLHPHTDTWTPITDLLQDPSAPSAPSDPHST